jgi:hypothetical protein
VHPHALLLQGGAAKYPETKLERAQCVGFPTQIIEDAGQFIPHRR